MKRSAVGPGSVLAFGLAALLPADADAKPWWESPEVKASVDTGVNVGAAPHYMNKDEGDRFLLVTLHASHDAYPVHLYSIPRLVAAHGATSGIALASAKAPDLFTSGTTSTTNGWKGGAVSDDLNIAFPGSGLAGGNALYTSLTTTNDLWVEGTIGTWETNRTAFRITATGDYSFDGPDFSHDSSHLYSNRYQSGKRNLITRWVVGNLHASGQGFTLDREYGTSVTRIRCVSVYYIGGKDLVYYGEGEDSMTSRPVYVFDPATETETQLLATLERTCGSTGDNVMNVKVSGVGTGQMHLYVQCNDGMLFVYELDADGKSVGSLVRTFSVAEMQDLAGVPTGSIFRNFEVTNDGRYAFLIHAATPTRLRVLHSPTATPPTAEVPVSIPFDWFVSNGLVEAGVVASAPYLAAGTNDADHDGFMAWTEYVTGTQPTNPASLFQCFVGMSGSEPVVTWAPSNLPGRVYTVLGSPDLAAWGPQDTNSLFFRVGVALP